MDDVNRIEKLSRRTFRNAIAGAIGIIAAAVLLLVTLRVQDFLTPGFVRLLIFVFPAPVACGIAVGLVSPRKAVAWAPLWSAILILLLSALLLENMHQPGAVLHTWYIVYAFAGAMIAALSGWFGQRAGERGYAGKSIVALIILCCGMGGIESLVLSHNRAVYEQTMVPQVLLELDADYIQLPKDLNWSCSRNIANGCYRLSSSLNGRPISVAADSDGPVVMGVMYEASIKRPDSWSKQSIRYRLMRLGFRDALLGGLSPCFDDRRCWIATLGGTRLIVRDNGRVRMEPLEGIR